VSPVLTRLETRSILGASNWCAVSKFIADRTQKVFALPNAPGAILYNCLELPPIPEPSVRKTKHVVFSGTLNENKGIQRLVEAWADVRQACSDAQLHVFGKDGRTRQGLSMKLAIEKLLGDPGRQGVFFHGHVPREQLLAALRSARVAVFPSYTEAFALGPLESMACGCPTVFTNRASGPEAIEDGIDGLLIDPDRPEQITHAILRVLQDDDLAARLSKAGRQKVEQKFSLNIILPQNEDFFAKCIREFNSEKARAFRGRLNPVRFAGIEADKGCSGK